MIESKLKTLYEAMQILTFLCNGMMTWSFLWTGRWSSWFCSTTLWLCSKDWVDGFIQILVTAKELAEDIIVVAIFPAKHSNKRQCDEFADVIR